MKKSLLLIFGVLGLVSLMAEGGPKRSSIMSMLGMEDEPICCDKTICCVDNDTSCCDLSSCCATASGCCAPTTSTVEANATSENTVNQCVVQCKK